MATTSSADRQRHWRKLIERQQGSGRSIVAFCAQERLNPASFHAWKRRLLGGPTAETGRTAARQALVPVQIVGGPAGGERNPGSPVANWRRAAGYRLRSRSHWCGGLRTHVTVKRIAIGDHGPISAAGPACDSDPKKGEAGDGFAWPPGAPADPSQKTVVF